MSKTAGLAVKKTDIRKWAWIWSGILILCWAAMIFIFLHNNGNLTLEKLLDYRPKNTLQAVLVMLGLFVIKSVDFVMHSGVLFAAGGIMFPTPAAIVLNLVGTAIICITPYWIGRTLGVPLIEYLLGKYPKLKAVSELRLKNDFLVSLLFRISGLPLNISSLYMGAMGFSFWKYLLGSLVGFFPLMLNFTVLGVAADDPDSPAFLIAIGVQIFLFAGSALVYRHLAKKANEKPETE